MKKLFLQVLMSTFLLILFFSAETRSQSGPLFTVVQNGKSGYIDKTGKLIVPCQYDFIKSDSYEFPKFLNGMIPFKQNGLWGMLDGTGKEIIKPIYKKQFDFRGSDYAKVIIPKNKNSDDNPFAALLDEDPYTIIDKKGNVAMPGEYTFPFLSGGLFGDILVYKKGEKVTFVNVRTKQESGKLFYSIESFINGCAVAKAEKDGKYGLIDEKGNWLISPQYFSLTNDKNGLLQADLEGKDAKWVLIDKSNKVMAGPFTQYNRYSFFSYATFSSEGLLPVKDKTTQLWGYINTFGKLVIPCLYNENAYFNDGITVVNTGGIKESGTFGDVFKNADWKGIDVSGKTIFILSPGIKASVFSEGRCKVYIGDQNGMIDAKGKYIIPLQIGIKLENYKNGLSLFNNEQGGGYYDLNGKVVWAASK